MTDNDIIKALEYCKEQGITSECEKCNIKEDCRRELIAIALDLIKRQKAEIERLNIRNKVLTEITKNYDWKFSKVKSEAIKEFAERVKQEINFPLAVWRVFDNLVKEMTEQ